ncbi:MAG: hypothetical protein Q9164_005342 [Protoblastenia rupestris]
MSRTVCIILSPALLLISIPLAVFAALTTTLAFSTLFIRALIVYVELASVLIQNQITPRTASKRLPNPLKSGNPGSSEVANARSKNFRRSSTASGSSNGGSTTPKVPSTSGFGIYGSEGPSRDFEGVGGWRIPGPNDEEDILWTNMNSRLELPTMTDGRPRNHHRSRTSGSFTAMPLTSFSRTTSRARTPTGYPAPGRSTSPPEYFRNRPPSKSTTSLDLSNTGKPLLRHKPSSSSGSSHSSIRTLHITPSNSGA